MTIRKFAHTDWTQDNTLVETWLKIPEATAAAFHDALENDDLPDDKIPEIVQHLLEHGAEYCDGPNGDEPAIRSLQFSNAATMQVYRDGAELDEADAPKVLSEIFHDKKRLFSVSGMNLTSKHGVEEDEKLIYLINTSPQLMNPAA